MNKLFGLDIAKIVNNEIKSCGNLQKGTLRSITPAVLDPLNLDDGCNYTFTEHSFQGFIEQVEMRREDMVPAGFMSKLLILGGSISPKIVPKVNDEITMNSINYTLTRLLERDGASATYVFRVEL